MNIFRTALFGRLGLTLALCMGLTGAASAIERSASNAVELQMTWSALMNHIKSADDKATKAHIKLTKIEACGALGRIYAPEAPKSIDGCIEAMSGGHTLTEIVNTINGNVSTVSDSVNNIKNMVDCLNKGMVFSGVKCVAVNATDSVVTPDYTQCIGTKFSSSSNAAGRDLGMTMNAGKLGQHWCPKDYSMVGVNNGSVNGALCCKMKIAPKHP